MAADEMALEMTPKRISGAMTFEELMALAERPVLRVCYRLLGNRPDAQDAAQEVLLKAYGNMAKFQSGQDPMPWLYHVAVNQCRDRLRRRKYGTTLESITPRETTADPEQQAVQAERKRLLVEGLAGLGERERTALVLRDLEGLDTREVARILEVAEETVRSQCSVARAKLKQFIEARSAL